MVLTPAASATPTSGPRSVTRRVSSSPVSVESTSPSSPPSLVQQSSSRESRVVTLVQQSASLSLGVLPEGVGFEHPVLLSLSSVPALSRPALPSSRQDTTAPGVAVLLAVRVISAPTQTPSGRVDPCGHQQWVQAAVLGNTTYEIRRLLKAAFQVDHWYVLLVVALLSRFRSCQLLC